MLISEFIDRTGFRPTEDYYHTVIEPEYNASDLEKDAWCKQWKKNGGIQKAYDALKKQAANEYANVLSLENEVKNLKEMNDNQSQVIRDEREKSFELSQTLDNAMSDLNAAQEREQSMMYEKEIYVIRDREAGNEIDEFETMEEALEELARFEEIDKMDGNYTPDFYEIVTK